MTVRFCEVPEIVPRLSAPLVLSLTVPALATLVFSVLTLLLSVERSTVQAEDGSVTESVVADMVPEPLWETLPPAAEIYTLLVALTAPVIEMVPEPEFWRVLSPAPLKVAARFRLPPPVA